MAYFPLDGSTTNSKNPHQTTTKNKKRFGLSSLWNWHVKLWNDGAVSATGTRVVRDVLSTIFAPKKCKKCKKCQSQIAGLGLTFLTFLTPIFRLFNNRGFLFSTIILFLILRFATFTVLDDEAEKTAGSKHNGTQIWRHRACLNGAGVKRIIFWLFCFFIIQIYLSYHMLFRQIQYYFHY